MRDETLPQRVAHWRTAGAEWAAQSRPRGLRGELDRTTIGEEEVRCGSPGFVVVREWTFFPPPTAETATPRREKESGNETREENGADLRVEIPNQVAFCGRFMTRLGPYKCSRRGWVGGERKRANRKLGGVNPEGSPKGRCFPCAFFLFPCHYLHTYIHTYIQDKGVFIFISGYLSTGRTIYTIVSWMWRKRP